MTVYHLARWTWQNNNFPRWVAPQEGQSGTLDLRSLAECGIPGGQGGFGIFSYPMEITGPGIITIGSDPEELIGSVRRSLMEDALQTTLLAPRLSGILMELFTAPENIDVTGATKRKPLMPTAGKRLDLHLGSLIKSTEIDVEDPTWPILQAQYKQDFTVLRQEHDEKDPLLGKILGYWMLRYGISDPSVFQEGKIIEPLDPSTTVTDTFDRADNTDLNASSTGKTPDFSWNELVGGWAISSNSLVTSAAGGFVSYYLRADIDLSSSDNYTQMVLSGIGGSPFASINGVMSRFASAATTGYSLIWNGYDSGGAFNLDKVVTGTASQIGSDGGTSRSDGDTIKVESSGSSITGYRNGSTDTGPVTDTSITVGVRGGARSWSESVGTFNNFEMADLAAAPSATPRRRQSLTLLGVS